MSRTRLRCAVYTRKSSEEGLDQAFNSLEAQREACEAYVRSQAGEGWVLQKTAYDDGGISGGTMERPALKRLLADIGASKVDVVVVYKVDRLTRSLSDFARIVETFDAHGVSFVSVTQQFNTTTSMGRLTLNVLLSFAQFEREVTAERIRDKIAASKRKGMWMGGVVPLGYDVVDRKLVINAAEADTVRQLYDLYLQHGSVQSACEEANRRGLRTKARTRKHHSRSGDEPFQRGHIYKLLANPIYIGEVAHKGERHSGEHPPIIDRVTWDSAQEKLARHAVDRRHGTNARTPSLLAGLLFDATGARLAPTHTSRHGQRYRYYVARAEDGHAGPRLPAASLEAAVRDALVEFLADERRLMADVLPPKCPAGQLDAVLVRAARLRNELHNAEPVAQRALLLDLVERIEMYENRLRIMARRGRLRSKLGIGEGEQVREGSDTATVSLAIECPIAIRRRGAETKLVIPGKGQPHAPDGRLISLTAQAHAWFGEIKDGAVASIRDLARRHGIDQGDASRILPLAFLAPDIVEAILAGRQPVELTVSALKRGPDLPALWADQRRLLGFA